VREREREREREVEREKERAREMTFVGKNRESIPKKLHFCCVRITKYSQEKLENVKNGKKNLALASGLASTQ